MNPLWKFILILVGLLVLGLAVVFAFRVVDAGGEPDFSLPVFGGDGPTGVVVDPIVVIFRNVGGRSVLRNYRIEIRVADGAAAAKVGEARTRLRDAFVVQLLDLSRHPWHSADAPTRGIVERRLVAAGREVVGPGIVSEVVVTEVTESPAP